MYFRRILSISFTHFAFEILNGIERIETRAFVRSFRLNLLPLLKIAKSSLAFQGMIRWAK